MINLVDVQYDNISALGDIKAHLESPVSGYHEKETILFRGWVLPSNVFEQEVQVIVNVDDNIKGNRIIKAESVMRPDVFKVYMPDIDISNAYSKIGFTVEIPFSECATASVNLIVNGHKQQWFSVTVERNHSVNMFLKKLRQPNILSQADIASISIEDIDKGIKKYFSHKISEIREPNVREHIIKLSEFEKSGLLIPSFFRIIDGHIYCEDFDLRFHIFLSRLVDDFNFVFCKDENKELIFIIVQSVTSMDGIYYPEHGIFVDFHHDSSQEIKNAIQVILDNDIDHESLKLKQTSFLIGHSRPYHFMYDGMLGLEKISQSIDGIDDGILFYTLESNAFIDALKVFNRKKSVNIVNGMDLTNLEKEGVLFIKIGSLFGWGAKEPVICEKIKSLDEKIIAYAREVNSHSEHIALDIKKHFPIIWIGVTSQKRTWLEQIEGYSSIINKLYQSFPGMAVVFDGWTSSLASLQRDKVESDNDRKITHEIIQRIAPDIKVVDLVGATIDKKIYIGSFVDFAIVNYSTGSMNVSRICGRPCITHMNNSFAPARHQHIHKNAYHIPEKYVTDVIEDGGRIDSTSYHINWEHIYDAMVSHLGQQNIINNRW